MIFQGDGRPFLSTRGLQQPGQQKIDDPFDLSFGFNFGIEDFNTNEIISAVKDISGEPLNPKEKLIEDLREKFGPIINDSFDSGMGISMNIGDPFNNPLMGPF